MTRSELRQAIAANNPGLPLLTVEAAVSCFFDEITNQLAEGGRVEIRGFGTFTTRAREERVGRNPRTGELVQVNATRALHFRPAGALSKSLAKGKN
jgi:integration host factor subunit beta